MGKIVKRHQPCPHEGCGSHDAFNRYEDGSGFCFSCQKWAPPEDGFTFKKLEEETPLSRNKYDLAGIRELSCRGLMDRKIARYTSEFFGVKVAYNTDGQQEAHFYPYEENKSYKARLLPKDFSWVGSKSKKLFGQEKFPASGKRLIITEGEVDALTVAQATFDHYKKYYPVVSIPSSTDLDCLIENRAWIRSFDEVVLFYDNDENGQKAVEQSIRIIGIDKVKIAKTIYKDANEAYLKEGDEFIRRAVWDAAPYVPSGIITREELWKQLSEYNDRESLPYPPCLGGLNTKLKGMRGGEITTFVSGTGSGKSTMLREIGIYALDTMPKEEKLGIISLEEAPAETARKFSGMALNRNPAAEEIPIDELKAGFDKVFGDDRVIVLDHQGSMSDGSVIDKIEYMALKGCTKVILDHITILVSEGVDNLTGNEAQDKIMNDLLRLVKRHPALWIGLVSHLRKAPNQAKSFEDGRLPSVDDIKGSGAIKQVSFDIVAFARNMSAEKETERNTIQIRVLKCRYTGLTGDVRGAVYNHTTGRLAQADSFQQEYTEI